MNKEPYYSSKKAESPDDSSREDSIYSEIKNLTSDEKKQLSDVLRNIPTNLSRRKFLSFLSIPTLYVAINAATRGLLHYWAGKLISDYAFRQKIVQELQDEGVAGVLQASSRAYESRTEITQSNYSLTEVPQFREEWMEKSFKSTKIFSIGEVNNPKTEIVETIDGWKRVENHEGQFVAFFEISKVSLQQTLETRAVDLNQNAWYEGEVDPTYLKGDFVALPAPQSDTNGNPVIYTAFFDGNKIREYKDSIGKNDGGRATYRGAYVIDINGMLVLATADEQQKYTVGNNCQLIQQLPFVVSSDSIEETYQEMDLNPDESGSVASNSAEYPSAVCTFYDKNGKANTYLLSLYNYVSKDRKTFAAGIIPGKITYNLFTIRELVEVAKAYALKNEKERFTVGFGDPAFSDVRVVNDQISPEEIDDADESILSISPTLSSLRAQLDRQSGREYIVKQNKKWVRSLGGYGADRGGYRFNMYDYQMRQLLLAHR